jgi:hypothetical protein
MKRSMLPLPLSHQTTMSIFQLEPYLQSRNICQEDLNPILTLPNRRRTVPNILNSRGDHKLSSVPPPRRFSRFTGVAIRDRGRTIQQSQPMVTAAITQRIVLGISMLMLSTQNMRISGPTQAADEVPTQPPGHSTHPPLTLHTQLMSTTTSMAITTTDTPPTTTWIEPAATPKRESQQKPSANSPADPTAHEATTATVAANTA